MTNGNLELDNILNHKENLDDEIRMFAIESFAKQVDYEKQTELLTQLIHDHSRVAKKLEKSRKLLSEAQEIALLGRWDYDFALDIVESSDSLYKIFELDPSTVLSFALFISAIHPDDVDDVLAQYQTSLADKKPWANRFRLVLSSGKIKWVHFKFYSEFDEQGLPSAFYGTIQDVTELKKIEDELERYNQHLEELVEAKVKEISDSQFATIFALSRLAESRDDDTGEHIERTANFCQLLAKKLQTIPGYGESITDSFIDALYKASPLHDIGKVGIADNILLKPGKLTKEEFDTMKSHVQIGYDTLAEVSSQYDKNEFLKVGMEITLYHHEKWNGSGYLSGLEGEDIPLSARIMALADVYDALRSKRVYKDAFSHEESVKIISESSGSHFDPTVVDTFLRYNKEFENLYEEVIKSL